MRAFEPAETGCVTLEGFQVGYEVFGDSGAPPVLLLPTWQIAHSRMWRMQVPFLARFRRVITLDAPGNGLGERTLNPAAYEYLRIANQAAGLLAHLGLAQADVVGFSRGCAFGLLLAAHHPDRVRRLALIGGSFQPTPWPPPDDSSFWERRSEYTGWDRWNAHYWREHYAEWLEFFFAEVFSEPHSTKPQDDGCIWGHETTPEILIQTYARLSRFPDQSFMDAVAQVQCPVLVIHGEDDHIDLVEASRSLAAARPDWELIIIEDGGHAPHVRHPVRFNLSIAEFLGRS